MTLLDIQRLFDTDDKCREALTKLRWPDGVVCPRCNSDRISWIQVNKQFDCAGCEYHFSVKAGTIFNDSHLPLTTWFTAVLLMVEAKKGMSALQLKRTLWGQNKGSYKTAWYLCHRVRAAMASAEKKLLDGKIEMDETYLGGKMKGKGVYAGKKAKVPVFGIKQRGGELRFFKAEDVKAGTLEKYIRENVSEDVEVIMTDELATYPWVLDRIGQREKHKTVSHKAGIYVDGDITTNGIESAFSLLKRGIIGSWHKVSAKHLPAYLEEMTFRFNRRNSKTLFLETLQHMVTAEPRHPET